MYASRIDKPITASSASAKESRLLASIAHVRESETQAMHSRACNAHINIFEELRFVGRQE